MRCYPARKPLYWAAAVRRYWHTQPADDGEFAAVGVEPQRCIQVAVDRGHRVVVDRWRMVEAVRGSLEGAVGAGTLPEERKGLVGGRVSVGSSSSRYWAIKWCQTVKLEKAVYSRSRPLEQLVRMKATLVKNLWKTRKTMY